MNFFEKHFAYIDACATARAWEIAEITLRKNDVEDYKQEMFLYLIKQINQYNPERSSPHTFISMLISSAKKTILRKAFRYKNKIINYAIGVKYA